MIKEFICAAEILVRVTSYDFDEGTHNYSMDLHNVYKSCEREVPAKKSAFWRYGGNQPGTYESKTKLPFQPNLYYWAIVTGECERSEGPLFEGKYPTTQWMCKVTKLDLIP